MGKIKFQGRNDRQKKIDNNLLISLDKIPYPIEILDLKGRFIFVNDSYKKNVASEDVIGKSIFSVASSEEHVRKTEEYFHKMLDGSVRPEKYIDRFYDEDGRIQGYQIEWDYLKDESGIEKLGFIVALSDISDNLRTKELYDEKNKMLNIQKATMTNLKRKMQLALEAANEGVWEWNLVTDEVQYDDRYFNLLGYKREDFRNVDNIWGHLVHPDDKELYNRYFSEFIDNNETFYEIQYRLKSKTGKWIWILDKGQVATRDEFGNPVNLIGIHMDITEIMEKKQEVERLKEELETAMEVSEITEWIFDFEKDIVSKKYVWQRFFTRDLSVLSICDNDIDLWCERIHKDDREYVFEKLEESISGKTNIFNVEYRLLCVNSSDYKWISDSGKVIKRKNDGSPLYMVGTRKDITITKNKELELIKSKDELKNEKKKSDELNKKLTVSNKELTNTKEILKYVLKNSKIGVWKWDIKNGNFIFDDTAKEILGNDVVENEPLRHWENKIIEEDRDKISEIVKEYFKGLIPEYMIQYRIKNNNNYVKWIQETGEIIEHDEKGNPSLFVGSIMDITIQKEIEELLVKAKNDAERTSKLKSDLISSVNHELRTPLTIIMGMTQTLMSMEKDEEKYSFLEQIVESSQRLLILIGEVLDISKMESGNIEVNEERVEIRKLLENISRGMLNQADRKGISYILKVSEEVSDYLWIDKGKVLQVLNNLIGNAIKFTTKGHVLLEVFVDKSKKLCFKVEDTGIGIKKENQQEIFKQFFQVDSSNKRKYGGTGLGLSIVKSIAEILNGEIKLESNFGEGSTFIFSIPMNNK